MEQAQAGSLAPTPSIFAPFATGRFRHWGPAWIVMMADVDAASILTAFATGAAYHYALLWFLALLVVPLFFIQEAAGRIGAVTGTGLGELARGRYSTTVSALIVFPMAGADVVCYIAEYAAIALALTIFGIPPLLSLPAVFVAHVALVAGGKIRWVERVLMAISGLLIITVLVALFLRGVLPYSPVYVSSAPAYVFLMAANAGAVVMPFMLFYQSSATAERGGTVRHVRRETLFAAVASEVLMIALVMIAAGLSPSTSFFSPRGFSSALSAVAGPYGLVVLGVGLVAAAFLALVVISLGSAWGVVEALGLPRSRVFWVYALESVPAVIVPLLIPSLLTLVLVLMVALVLILVGPGILVGRLAADPGIMGSSASRGFWKIGYWASLAFVVGCGVIALV